MSRAVTAVMLLAAFPTLSESAGEPGKAASNAFPAPLVVSPGAAAEKTDDSRAVPRRSSASMSDQLIEQINILRATYWASQGFVGFDQPPLKRASELSGSANGHAQTMAQSDFIAHCYYIDPPADTISDPEQRMAEAGYLADAAGEIIAAGYASESALLDAMLASPGHLENLLSPEFWEIGVGHAYDLYEDEQGNVWRDLDQDCLLDSANNGPFYHYLTISLGRRSAEALLVINGEETLTDSSLVDLYVYRPEWATKMRFRNEGGAWSGWEGSTSHKSWQLSAGGGTKTVTVQLCNSDESECRESSDTILFSVEIFSDGFESGDLSAWSLAVQ